MQETNSYPEIQMERLKGAMREEEKQLSEKGFVFRYCLEREKELQENIWEERVFLTVLIDCDRLKKSLSYECVVYENIGGKEENFPIDELENRLLTDIYEIRDKGEKAFKKVYKKQFVAGAELLKRPFFAKMFFRLGVVGTAVLALAVSLLLTLIWSFLQD